MSKRSVGTVSREPKNLSATKGRGKGLFQDVRLLIDDARTRAFVTVNSEMTQLYWMIGKRILKDVLGEARADYGRRIVSALGRQLSKFYGSGFSEKSLRHMIRFAEVYPDQSIVSALWRQLTWTHFKAIIYLEDPLRRDFYVEMCRLEQWSVRTMRRQMDAMLFERTALSKRPLKQAEGQIQALREDGKLAPDLVFRDPYVLDFLGLHDSYAEKDLEAAILRELERFILELGTDFAFVARQKRILIDDEDYHIDLLFYHRRMRRLVAIDLKLGKFQAADKGQMELYLRWLSVHERQEGEDEPLGLILCAGKSAEQIELLRLEDAGIRVATYMTQLPSRKILKSRLHDAIRIARHRLEQQEASSLGKPLLQGSRSETP